jgi:predicted TIM-barrel fold metal-dependent hydrolase
MWATAEEIGMTIGVHEGSSVIVPTLGSDRPFNPFILHAVSHAFEEMLACAQLIAFGVLDRHPDLRVVFLESSGGWVPFWMERLNEQAESFGAFCPEMNLAPSEYFARQCWISYEIDERTLPALTPFIGSERIVWGSDYPHHDATFPGAVAALRRTLAPLDEASRARILGENAAELYRLPPWSRP